MSETINFPLRESQLPWELMAYNGVDVEWLRSQPALINDLCRGIETSAAPIQMREQFSKADREQFEKQGQPIPDVKSRPMVEGTIRAYIDKEKNEVKLLLTSRRPFPDLKGKDKTYMGHTFTDEDVFMLLSTNSMGRAVELTDLYGKKFEAFVGIHPITNAMRYMRTEHALRHIPTQVCGHTFTPDEIDTLKRGDVVKLKGLQSKYNDKTFDAYFMFSASTWNTQFLSEKAVLAYQRNRGVIPRNATSIKEVVGVAKHPTKGKSENKEQTLTPPKSKGVKKGI